jgi:hypothetical protein
LLLLLLRLVLVFVVDATVGAEATLANASDTVVIIERGVAGGESAILNCGGCCRAAIPLDVYLYNADNHVDNCAPSEHLK